MSTSNLIHKVLGAPIPWDDHGVSVSLPTWQDVVDYEEGHPHVVSAMKSGYPRFKIHQNIELLSHIMNERFKSKYCHILMHYSNFILPTKSVAQRFKKFLIKAIASLQAPPLPDLFLEPVLHEDLWAVFLPESYIKTGKAFWQHTGEIISSRQAEDALIHFSCVVPPLTAQRTPNKLRSCLSTTLLSEKTVSPSQNELVQTITTRLANYVREDVTVATQYCGITLTVSGMASIYSALRLVHLERLTRMKTETFIIFQQLNDGEAFSAGATVVFGFPYIDTLKLNDRVELNSHGNHFFGYGDERDLNRLDELLQVLNGPTVPFESTSRIVALFTELPSNPLLRVPNLTRLTALATQYDFFLIVDDTISSFANVDLLHSPGVTVDILCSSLTKTFVGRGDAMAGSLIINSHGRYAQRLRELIPKLNLPPLYVKDAFMVELNSRDYPERCSKTNLTARKLVQWIQTLSCVHAVYYPIDSFIRGRTNTDTDVFNNSLNDSNSESENSKRCVSQNISDRTKSDERDSDRLFSDVGINHYMSVLRTNDNMCPEFREKGVEPGYGCLFSIVFRKKFNTKVFYDALDMMKGPSLGTNYSLVCPYTLLAHYTELPWAEEYNVSKDLIRVSVGLEPLEVNESNQACHLLP